MGSVSSHWLIVGNSESAVRVGDVRQPRHRVVAVTEPALERVPDADVWVNKDPLIPRHCFTDDIAVLLRALLDRGGEGVVPRETPAWPELTVVIQNDTNTFVRGGYGATRKSGPLAVYWAINHGAEEIDIVGFEGEVEYHHGMLCGAYVEQARLLCAAAAACPDISFRYYGDLTWEIEGANVEVIA